MLQLERIPSSDFWWQLGRRSAGPLFLGFTQWLIREVKKGSFDQVCFLARDGFILEKVYERLRREDASLPPSIYLYASRRALNVPAIVTLDDTSLHFLTWARPGLRVREYLERIGLDASSHIDDIATVGFDGPDAKINTKADRSRLVTLFRKLDPFVMAIAAQERLRLARYLSQCGVSNARRVAVVDIGWHGTLQRSLRTVLDSVEGSTEIAGFYLGTFPAARQLRSLNLSARGYLCEEGNPTDFHDAIRSCVELFEFLFLAPHSGVVCFEEVNGRMEPVFGANDNEPQKVEYAKCVQAGALEFIEESISSGGREIDREDAFRTLRRILERPTKEEAIYLGDLYHSESFGNPSQCSPIAKPPKSKYELLRPHKIYLGYRAAFWQVGYLVRIFGNSRCAQHIHRFVARWS
jgi:predicted HAD superfamily hydrolase